MNLSQLLFSFNGRINRARYWGAVGIMLLIGISLGILQLVLHGLFSAVVSSIISGSLSLISLIPSFAIEAKRLHDRDLSAWWMFAQLAPAPVLILGAILQSPALMICAGIFMFSFGVWLFVQTGCLRGTDGPNRFGSDPLDPGASLSLNLAE
ncbi:DUF805 domain-containing protein [Microvirga sp. 2MCAF38]|uniref:DUF805 domain-containing protein n=1 Tax=Microvirga sp. 2MCAF38 TaxID=3232989 RepID=UPI003F959703